MKLKLLITKSRVFLLSLSNSVGHFVERLPPLRCELVPAHFGLDRNLHSLSQVVTEVDLLKLHLVPSSGIVYKSSCSRVQEIFRLLSIVIQIGGQLGDICDGLAITFRDYNSVRVEHSPF